MWPKEPIERILLGVLIFLIAVGVLAMVLTVKAQNNNRTAEAVEYMIKCPMCEGTGFVKEKEKEDVETEMGEYR